MGISSFQFYYTFLIASVEMTGIRNSDVASAKFKKLAENIEKLCQFFFETLRAHARLPKKLNI